MRKLLELSLAVVICLSLISCGSDSSSTETKSEGQGTTVVETAAVASEESLADAVDLIKEAEEDISTTAALQLEGWSKYSEIVNYYFDDTAYEDATEISIASRARKCHGYRTSAIELMEEAHDLIGTDGEGDYYDAVKNYYLTVNNFLSLISEFPEGYSKLTYSSTVSDYNNDCQSAYGELEFYQ